MTQSTSDGTHRPRGGVFRRRTPGVPSPTEGTTRRTRYVDDGHLVRAPRDTTVLSAQAFTDKDEHRTALLLYPKPTPGDVAELTNTWNLHPLLVEDLLHAGQRPKLERYDDTLFLVVRSAWYIDEKEDVDFAEFHILVRPQAVAVFCQDGRWIDGLDADDASGAADRGDHTLLDDEQLLHHGPEAIVYRLLDAIVDGYTPVLQASPLTVNRSNVRCSAATLPSPNASTASARRSSTSNKRPQVSPKCSPRFERDSAATTSPNRCSRTSRTSRTTSAVPRHGLANFGTPFRRFSRSTAHSSRSARTRI